jgi:hypothetical protein
VSSELTKSEITVLGAARLFLLERADYAYDDKPSDVRIAVLAEAAERAIFQYLNNYNAYSDAPDLTYEQLHGRPAPAEEVEA